MTFDLNPDYGSHVESLSTALDTLSPGALVIEHGPGTYSTPLIARRDVRVLVVEAGRGWASWSRWFYEMSGRTMDVVERHKHCVNELGSCGLLFIDGEARERGTLLGWALERKTPLIVAHDTEETAWHEYQYQSHHFSWRNYDVTHDHGHRHRTTTWRLRA